MTLGLLELDTFITFLSYIFDNVIDTVSLILIFFFQLFINPFIPAYVYTNISSCTFSFYYNILYISLQHYQLTV